MYNNLIDKHNLNYRLSAIYNEKYIAENKELRHKKIQEKFIADYNSFKKKQTIKAKRKKDTGRPKKKISTIEKIPSANHQFTHYKTLKAIAKIVGVNFK